MWADYMRVRAGSVKSYLKLYGINLFVAVDQLCNAILFGDPDETISSRLAKWRTSTDCLTCRRIGYMGCRILHWIDTDHCLKVWEKDEGSKSLTK